MQVRTAAAVAGVAGFASMCLELTAVRLLAPHFGDSAYVWTNVIGVILAALAMGAWCGGRLADRGHGRTSLAALFVLAAVLTALAPVWGRGLGAWLLPQDLPLDAAMPAMVRGSLAAAGLLFGLPVFLLGAIAPVLVTLAAGSGSRVGRAVGAVSAAGTLGSLLGTFLATHWLVPTFGCRATMWVCALLLGVGAVLVRPAGRVVAAGVLVGLGLLLQDGPLRPASAGLELLAEAETSQQYLQVVRDPQSPGGALTALKINEGLDSFHSVSVESSVFTGGRYYDYHALAPLLAGDGRRPEQLRALSIGDAAGSFRRIYDAVHPGATVDAVELDPAAIALGEHWFLGRKAPGRVFAGIDGRVFIDQSHERWHVIHVDAYAHQIYVPAHLASREFFAAARERLLPGGVLTCNVGGLHVGDPVLQALGGTLASVFGEAFAFHVPRSRNFLLVARRDAPLVTAVLDGYQPGAERLRAADQQHWLALLAEARVRAAWHRLPPAATPLQDDRPELDRILLRSYLDSGDGTEPISTTGQVPVAEAEQLAFTALQVDDLDQVLAHIRAAVAPSAYLRLLCGDARWRLRQLHGALAEYRAGAALQPEAERAALLTQRVTDLQQDLQPHATAEQLGRRNGWLAGGVALVGLLLAAALLRWPAGVPGMQGTG